MSELVTAELLERVRERLAEGAADPDPALVAAAIRAEAGGVLADTDLLRALRLLQTEMTGAGVLEPLLHDPEVADVLVTGPDSVWVDRGGACAGPRCGSPTRRRCAGSHSGWHWGRAAARRRAAVGGRAAGGNRGGAG